jgi:hypothetical protein
VPIFSGVKFVLISVAGRWEVFSWATPARERIGTDVWLTFAKYSIAQHDMVYVSSTERKIPLPSNYVDVLFTLNALDHIPAPGVQ